MRERPKRSIRKLSGKTPRTVIKVNRVNGVIVTSRTKKENIVGVRSVESVLPIIKEGKFEEFMEVSKRNAITKNEISEIRESMKDVVQKKRRGKY